VPSEPPHTVLQGPYTGSQPRFYGREACPWLESVEAEWRVVRDEFEEARRGLALRRNFDPYGFDVEGWRTLNFQTYLRRYPESWRAFPRTARLLESIPRLTSAFLNVLEPRTRIPAHFGDSNTIVRCHLGLSIPGDVDACGIQVGEERRGWQEGRALAFCDAHRHFAWNETDRSRVVLVFDVMRPEYWADRHRICGDVLAAIGLTLFETRTGLYSRLPSRARAWLHRGLGLATGRWVAHAEAGRVARTEEVPTA
jgi:aspartyl/asparaginyl beta-hydroxylase (cupin superfamily)